MSRAPTVPAYRLHKPSGQARVIIDGRHVYLGKHGTPASQEGYARLIGERFAAAEAPQQPLAPAQPLRNWSIDQVLLNGFDGLGPASWVYGDFTYDGVVTADDFTVFLYRFDHQAGPLSGNGPVELLSSGGPVAVPEPSSMLLLVLGALGLAWRKTRGKTIP